MTTTTMTAPGANATPPARATQPSQSPAEIIEKALGKGDLSSLTAEQRMDYLRAVCESLGLNPLTQPFAFLTDKKGKTVLYARKDCTDQLRKIHGVTLEIAARDIVDELCIVHVKAHAPAPKGGHKRSDEDIGVVSLAGLRGEDRANAIMKAITKGKRRVTLSICGLGLLDETEVEYAEAPRVTVQASRPAEPAALPAPVESVAAQTAATEPAPVMQIRPEQIEELKRLKAELGIDAATWTAWLEKMHIRSAMELSPVAADAFIAALKHEISTRELEEGMGADGLPNLPPPPPKRNGEAAKKQASFPRS